MSISFPVLFLVALAMYIGKLCTSSYLKNREINFEILALVFFAIFYPISGIAHLSFPDNFYRGFFDTINYKSLDQSDHLNLMSILITYIAAAGLIIGMHLARARATSRPMLTYISKSYLIKARWLGILLTVTSIAASLVIFKSIDMTTIERSRSLETGIAKFIFISTWLGWGLSYIYMAQIKLGKLKSSLSIAMAFLIVALLISANVAWTGGRSIVFVLVLPLIMLTLRAKKGLYLYVLLPYIAGLVFYIIFITTIRTEGFAEYNISLSTLLDWEFGRYSMVGYAVDYVDRNDFLYGSTFISAFMSVLSGPLNLIGLRDLWGQDQSLIYIAGADILGVKGMTYIVPGFIAEAYMNFGFFGVFFFLLLVGWGVKVIDYKLSETTASSIHKPLFVSYIGTLICLQLFNSTSQAFLNYVLFTGFPLIAAYVLLRTKKLHRQKILRPQPGSDRGPQAKY